MAAEVAAIWPDAVRALALIAPFGLFDEKDPPTDPWAQRADAIPGLMCADPETWTALKAAAGGRQLHRMADRADPRQRSGGAHLLAAGQHEAGEAAAVDHRADAADLGRAGSDHAAQLREGFQSRIAGSTELAVIEGAGHLAELDQPRAVADAILGWFQ